MDLQSLIDDALEVTVVGSFSRVGYQVRQRIFAWDAPADGSMTGRTVLITGPTSGLGRAAADAVATLGARVVLVGRSEARLAEVRDALVAGHGEDRFPVVVADMGSLVSVRAAVAQVLATEPHLDVLIDSAGAIYPELIIGPDGIEATLAIMAVAPFVLIGGLLPLLAGTDDARVICVTSGGMYSQGIDLDDLQWATEPFSGPRAYAKVKRVQVGLVREWARRLREAGRTGVRVNAMHPGWTDTPGLAEQLPGFHDVMGPVLRTPAEGVDTTVWLATDPDAGSRGGQVFLDRRPRPFDRVPSTRLSGADRRRLWDIVVDLSGGPDPITGV